MFYKDTKYTVSKDGVVTNSLTGHILKPRIANGYWYVEMTNNNKSHKVSIHRLLCIIYLPNPENKLHVNHKNGIKTDNRLENLEWCTPLENARHAIETGLIARGKVGGSKSKYSVSDYKNILSLRSVGYGLKELAVIYGCGASNICHISNKALRGDYSRCFDYVWS